MSIVKKLIEYIEELENGSFIGSRHLGGYKKTLMMKKVNQEYKII